MKGILESLILIGMFVAVVIVLTIADRRRSSKSKGQLK